MAKVKPCEECGGREEYNGLLDGLLDRFRRSDYPDEVGPPGHLRYPIVRICGRCWGTEETSPQDKQEGFEEG